MITRAVQAGTPVRWVAADEVYGGNTALRAELEELQLGYVLAISCDHRVRTHAGIDRVDTLITSLPKRAWQRVSAGQGAHGHRFYDWALAELAEPDTTGQRWLLARRNRRTDELAYYRCHAPHPMPLSTLVTVAGPVERRRVLPDSERTNRSRPAPGAPLALLVPLDHAGDAGPRLPGDCATAAARTRPAPAGLIPLTLPEIARLFHALLHASPDQIAHILGWSTWRRRHQHRARRAHYQQQSTHEP